MFWSDHCTGYQDDVLASPLLMPCVPWGTAAYVTITYVALRGAANLLIRYVRNLYQDVLLASPLVVLLCSLALRPQGDGSLRDNYVRMGCR